VDFNSLEFIVSLWLRDRRFNKSQTHDNQGFTLIELLVVIIIIGLLAAIALPSFLNQASKARQSEAKTYTGSMIRAQQAYYLEKQQFAPDLTTLATGIPATTANYSYASTGAPRGSTGTDVNAISTAFPSNQNLKAYGGVINLATSNSFGEATTLADLCEAELAQANGGASTFVVNTHYRLYLNQSPTCVSAAGAGYTPIN